MFELAIANYDEPPENIKDYLQSRSSFAPYFAMVIFSDAVQNKRGEWLAKFLVDEKLGVVVESPAATNPNTLHKIKTWIFVPNHVALKKWIWKKVYKDG